MRYKIATYGGAGLVALAGLVFALFLVQDAQANCQKNPDLPRCQPNPPPPPPPPAPQPSPPPPVVCSTGAGKDGQPGNDDCATVTTSPPPPPVLNCPAGYQETGRTGGQVLCLKTTEVERIVEKPVVKTRTVVKWRTRVKVRTVIRWKTKTRTIHHFCKVPGNG